jgi:hypothetical protein
MREAHASRIDRYFVVTKIVENLYRYVYYPKMQEQVEIFVIGCVLYITSKPSNINLGIYMPLTISSRPWESISMDFVGGLPMFHRGNEYLFVMVEYFSNMCVLIQCKKMIFG